MVYYFDCRVDIYTLKIGPTHEDDLKNKIAKTDMVQEKIYK